MKNLLVFIAMSTLPMLTFGQDAPIDTKIHIEAMTLEALNSAAAIDHQIIMGTFSKNDVTELSYKKSLDIISIKAYRKSLQIKVTEVKSC